MTAGRPPQAPSSSFFGGPFREFEHVGGVHLAGTILWCDADRKNGLNFLSSALAKEIGRNRRVLCTEETHKLATRGKGKVDVLTAPYDQPLQVGELELSLHPAGPMLGAAQLRVERSGRIVVYASDVSIRPSQTAPAAEPVKCDVLALSATYGGRSHAFPPQEEVVRDLEAFIEATVASRRTPVLLVQTLGMGPELLVLLTKRGHRVRAHRAIADVAKAYQDLGVALPPFKRLSSRVARGEVLLIPPILRRKVDDLVPDARIALVGPRAIDAPHVHHLGVASSFALSNFADRADLLTFVEATEAEEVFVTGGEVEAFSEALRSRGLRVHRLRPSEQLELF